MVELFVYSGDPDQMPHSAASDLGLHCLPAPFLGSPDYNGLELVHLYIYIKIAIWMYAEVSILKVSIMIQYHLKKYHNISTHYNLSITFLFSDQFKQ